MKRLWLAIPLVTVFPSCKTPEVGVSLTLDARVETEARFVELAVFHGSCPDPSLLAGGLPENGSTRRVGYPYRRDDPNPPAIGHLEKGNYAFAATVRGEDCSVLASGCASVRIPDKTDVEIPLVAAQGSRAGCPPHALCSAARCVPTSENVGAGCSMALLGAGPLGDPLAFGGVTVSPPAIARTDTGFLIAYREADPAAGISRLTMLPIGTEAGALAREQITLQGSCIGELESDGIGLAFVGDLGAVARARPVCNGSGGTEFFLIDGRGKIRPQGNVLNRFGDSVSLSPLHALSPAPPPYAEGNFLLTFTLAGEARVVEVSGGIQQNALPFGPKGVERAVVAGAARVALATLGSKSPSDAGAGDGGSSASAISLSFTDENGPLPGRTIPVVEDASRVFSLGTQGNLVYLVTDSADDARPVLFRVFANAGATPVFAEALAPLGKGPILFADVAFQDDKAFFAVEQPNGITLFAYQNAATVPRLLATVFLPGDRRVPQMNNLRDGAVAVAASSTRVAVTWANARELTANDAVGGYAVFACSR